ncbi:MAG: dihydroorotate dehydrogenase [Nitrososphaerales archaeon]
MGNNIDLSVDIAGLRIRNPTMLASGILGISYQVFKRLYGAGAGAIVSKSISVEPREGYKNPTVVSVECGYLNAVGLSNPGMDAFAKEIENNSTVPIIVNLVGSTEDEFVSMVNKFDNLDVIAYELNLSCPHVDKVGLEVGDDPELVYKVVKGIKSKTKKPVIAKVGLGASDIIETARVSKEAGADAITAINTIRAMAINIEVDTPFLSNRIGGLSGKAIKPIAIRCVYEISKNLSMPVIGCGGVYSWEDAVEFMLAGATAVQMGSVIGDKWLKAFSNVTRGVGSYLEKKGMKSVMELVGIAHRY